MIWLLLSTLALAQDAPAIKYVPPGATVEATVPSFLLPEAKYDACLLKARELRIVDGALTTCLTGCDSDLETAESALTVCEGRFVSDGREIAGLRAQIAIKDERITDLRRQRNTAMLIAAGTVTLAFGGLALAVAL